MKLLIAGAAIALAASALAPATAGSSTLVFAGTLTATCVPNSVGYSNCTYSGHSTVCSPACSITISSPVNVHTVLPCAASVGYQTPVGGVSGGLIDLDYRVGASTGYTSAEFGSIGGVGHGVRYSGVTPVVDITFWPACGGTGNFVGTLQA